MGVVKTKNDIYRLALDKINSELGEFATASESGFLPENRAVDYLDLLVGKTMETYRFPFSIVRVPLVNEIVNELATSVDGEQTGKIFVRPKNIANILGVYSDKNLPFIESIINDYHNAKAQSISYSLYGNDGILIPSGAYLSEQDVTLYLVYFRQDPSVEDMTNLFQNYLVLDLASHIYLGHTYRNSNIYRALQMGATLELEKAKANIAENAHDYTNVLPTFLDIARYANKDGQITNTYERS